MDQVCLGSGPDDALRRIGWPCQAPAERTTLGRAIELVDAHLAKARQEPNADLKRRLEIEGYLALLSLPSNRRPYEAADRLRTIDEALGDKPVSGDRE